MIRYKLALVTLLLCTCVSAVQAQTPSWAPYPSKEGRFTVNLPGAPVITTQNESTPVGGIVEHIFTVLTSGESFTVNYQDLPEMAVLFGGSGRIYNGARDGFLKDNAATQSSYGPTTLGNHHGFLLLWTAPPDGDRPAQQGKVEFFLVGRRLYVVAASWPQSGSSADADQFFTSFQITR